MVKNTSQLLNEKKTLKPKRPINAFLLFAIERRKSLAKERPDLVPFDLQRVCAFEWQEMLKSEREPYLRMAQADKERYRFEVSQQADDGLLVESFYLAAS